MKKLISIRIYAIIFLTAVTAMLIAANIYVMISYPLKYKDIIYKHCKNYSLDEAMIFSIIRTESTFNPDAVSNAGAIGLMQLMPATAAMVAQELNIEGFTTNMLYDPDVNIKIGVHYFDSMLKKFKNIYTALAAYNAGEGNVSSWLNNPEYSDDGVTLKYIPFKETQGYIKKIKKNYRVYENRLK